MNKINHYRRLSVFITLAFILFSIYIVFDASSIWAGYKYNDEFYYLKRQSIYGVLAIIFFIIGMKFNLEKYRKFYIPFLLISNILLVLVLIPGIGIQKGGSFSWLGFGSFTFQPSEFYKLSLIIFTADYISNNYRKTSSIFSLFPIFISIIIGGVLLMLQPDFGTFVVIGAALIIMLFLSKMKIKYFVFGGSLVAILFAIMIISEPYRLQRIISFIDPFSDPLGAGFQIIQSMFAIGPGGLLGTGINSSIQKYYYLPEPQTDFIFAIIVEEFGFVGGVIIILLYFLLFYYLYQISIRKKSMFKYLLSMGLLSLIVVQVVINLGVVTALFPVTGITLPFLSYGGSSLITLSFSVGLIIGDDKQCGFC